MIINIDGALVRNLISDQFPQWKDLSIKPVAHGGWDNRTFHLGDTMLVRMPSAAQYAAKVEIEHIWLPKLAPLLPLQIPKPLVLGKPGHGYPFAWSIYQWIAGEDVAHASNFDLNQLAQDLAQFLIALQNIDPIGGPLPGEHNFYRGGSLAVYDVQTREAIEILKDTIDVKKAIQIWERALATEWQHDPVWVHGDIAAGNLLIRDGRLCAVIDFGGMAVGDPACDLAIAWTLFKNESRAIFRSQFSLDEGTWHRACAWALWKALIIAAGQIETNAVESEKCWQIIDEILTDYR